MIKLLEHPYRWFTDADAFLHEWGGVLSNLAGQPFLHLWGVWDRQEDRWFDDGPMLAEFASCVLSVNVSCEYKLAVGKDDIFPTEKPVWLEEADVPGLGWQEDLCWKEYDPVQDAFGRTVRKVDVVSCRAELRGLEFTLDGGHLRIFDAGDVIAAEWQGDCFDKTFV